ncbi:hypothetical protein AX15_001836 [Amanita polypyramis BW_CC]|nr:hypothetical protein AX15_001836 [Amanita polypyramis BW_CC]
MLTSILVEKIESGYGFIAQNYQPGDEIFLFGFSRGAYTARMIAILIGEIGILDRKDMDSFAEIFRTYREMGNNKNETEMCDLKEKLTPWTDPDSRGRQRADPDGDGFTVRCICVFDTVSSVGLPEEVSMTPPIHSLFGLSDKTLGKHIERAYQALALDEDRVDFNCVKFVQTEACRQKGQSLKQCWFSGSHSDVGGGFPVHDLANLTMMWMVGQVSDILSLDADYLRGSSEIVAPWGKQAPHNPRTGIFSIASATPRPLPSLDPDTQESVHPSVHEQEILDSRIKDHIEKYPELICQLTPLEEEWKQRWPYDPNTPQAQRYRQMQTKVANENGKPEQRSSNNSAVTNSSATNNERDSLFLRFLRVARPNKGGSVRFSTLLKVHHRSETQA